jgi:hypothetical protein
MAQDYEDLAEDLENGAIEIRHPELLPQHIGHNAIGNIARAVTR